MPALFHGAGTCFEMREMCSRATAGRLIVMRVEWRVESKAQEGHGRTGQD